MIARRHALVGGIAVALGEIAFASRCGNDETGHGIDSHDRRHLMHSTSLPSQDGETIEESVIIQRPVEEVFAFYRDLRNLPSFLGDVMAVEQIDPKTYRWTIQGPLGIRGHWNTTVTEERPNELIRYETAETGTAWEMHFAPGPQAGSTEVREVMEAPLGKLGRLALALIGKFPREEVTANLHRLKQRMETGHVTDTSYAVAGKFDRS
jgi:uncharacterized membrane protein